MISWWMRRRIQAFENEYDYDMSYVRQLLDVSPKAAMLYAKATQLGTFRQGVPADVYCVAQLVAVMREDCGPCVQLGVKLARKAGVSAKTLRAVVTGDFEGLSKECALAARFAVSVLQHDPEADTFREELKRHYGNLGVVSLACAVTVARIYPTMKYALGHGKACTRVVVDGEAVVARPAQPAVVLA